MARTRALMTETERARIAGKEDVEDIKRYQAISRVRRRIEEELVEDMAILREHHEGLSELTQEVVCGGSDEKYIAASDLSEPEPARSDPKPETPSEPAEDPVEPRTEDIDQRVWSIVEETAENWDDDERLETRKRAAAAVLQHALETGEGVGRQSAILKEVRERYWVDEQNEETYWRQNVRPVLKAVGSYSKGSKKYTVDSIE